MKNSRAGLLVVLVVVRDFDCCTRFRFEEFC